MDVDESLLTLVAASIEIGLPVILVAIAVRSVRFRSLAVSTLGAVTPLLGVYLYATIGFIFNGTEEGSMGMGAIWISSFLLYCILALIGILVGIVYPSKGNNYMRYAVALILAPSLGAGFLWLEQAIA